MLYTRSNFIEKYSVNSMGTGSALTNNISGIDCCQVVRQSQARGWLVYAPKASLDYIGTSETDIKLYIDFLNGYIKGLKSTIKYLGIEKTNLCPNNVGNSMIIESDCYIFLLENSTKQDEYSWEVYVSFILLRNLYIYYGWPYSKALISLLKSGYKYHSDEQLIGLSYMIGHYTKENKTRFGYDLNVGNQILDPRCFLKTDWIAKWNKGAKDGIPMSVGYNTTPVDIPKVEALIKSEDYDKLTKYIFKLK